MKEVIEAILSLEQNNPVRVAIDGVDTAGKKTFADNLSLGLVTRGRKVIRASLKNFHFPRDIRYLRGRHSAEGYYRDSFDYQSLTDVLLDPLSPQGNRRYKTAVFDHSAEQPIHESFKVAAPDEILIFDGVFAFRPELIRFWDLKLLLIIDPQLIMTRAVLRKFGRDNMGKSRALMELYRQRYIPGHKIYFREVDPKEQADLVIDNSDFINPIMVVNRLSPNKN